MKNQLTYESVPELVDHIVENHHNYIRNTIPHLLAEVYKLAINHGDLYPFMKRVFILFSQIKSVLESNMTSEENIVFPFIKVLDKNDDHYTDLKLLPLLINQVKEEHEFTAILMNKIRNTTNNYEIKAGYCMAMQLAIASLKSFECNLLIHIDLENNILFDGAIAMQSRLFKASA